MATVLTVTTPIKIWNNARIEHRLQEQEKLLLAAKVEALKSQINPHFLFNTLASVSSLIRSEPDTARMVIQKLSGLLRKLMRSDEQFFRHAAGRAAGGRVPGHRGGPLRRAAFGPQGRGDRGAGRDRAQPHPAAPGRERHQARARSARWAPAPSPSVRGASATPPSSRWKTTGSASR
ncbi:MAG: histidine kinase [Vicinamibacterales bacterium]